MKEVAIKKYFLSLLTDDYKMYIKLRDDGSFSDD